MELGDVQAKPVSGVDRGRRGVPQFEDILESLGSFGHWQRVIFVLICLADIYGAFAMLLPVFTGATPPWHGTVYADDDLELNASGLQPNLTLGECSVHNLSLTEAEFEGDFTSIVSEWSLVCSSAYASDLITSIQMLGLTLGALVFGQLSDLVGRKLSYFLSYSFLIVAGFVSALAPSWQVYAFCRLLVGLGFGALMVVNCVYPLEFVGRRWRTLCGTIGFWAVGQPILALVAYFMRDWRHLTMATSISGVLFYITWFFIPESPRWLLQQGRLEEAETILATIARRNGRPAPERADLVLLAKQEQHLDTPTTKYTYLDLFKTWKYCKITLIQLLAWFSCFLIYYELSYNLRSLSGDRYINMVLAGLVDLGAMLSVIPLNNTIGRKKAFILFVALALVGNLSLLTIYASGSSKARGMGITILVFALLGKAAALAGTYVAQIFSAELYPTVIRNVGVGAAAVAGRIGGIVAPQLVFLGTYSVSAPFIVSSALCLVVLPLVLLLRETRGRPLQDTL